MKSIVLDRMFQTLAAVSIGGVLIAGGFILAGEVRRGAEPQNIGELGGTERYLVHVATDKPIYRTGERLYVRGVVSPCRRPYTDDAQFESDGLF